ncbi:MAG: hypothetical protein WC644_11590 [Ignavibacteria bacterium]
MNTNEIILALISSAAIGAILGKLLDAYLITRKNDEYERKKWLRQTKFESFAKISEEILSLGFNSNVHENLWKFKALSVQTILLIKDKQLKKDIEEIIEELIKIADDTSSIVKVIQPDYLEIELPDGTKGTKKNLEVGYAIDIIEKKAYGIIERLGKDLRDT